MGNEISCTDSRFRLAEPEAALRALKRENRRRPLFDVDDIPEHVEHAETIVEAIEACLWDVECDGDGLVERLFYEGKYVTGDEDVDRFFAILAPYVESGSYLRIDGEDGESREYRFEDGEIELVE